MYMHPPGHTKLNFLMAHLQARDNLRTITMGMMHLARYKYRILADFITYRERKPVAWVLRTDALRVKLQRMLDVAASVWSAVAPPGGGLDTRKGCEVWLEQPPPSRLLFHPSSSICFC